MPDQVDWRSMERDASPGRAVGRLLRDQRLARNLSIDDVAGRLRIRSRYLEAIEQGRFDQLPGAAYIPAFLRGYANHVGLDADQVMTAYQLSGPVPIARPVALPADFPLAEKRAPIGLAMLTVLLVLAAGYAAWHYLPRQQTIVSQKVPPVPDRLLAVAPAAQPAAPVADSPAPPPVQEVRAPSPPPPQEVRAPSPPAAEMWPAPKQEPAAPALPPPVVVSAPPPPPVVMPTPAIGQAQAAQAPVVEVARPAPAPAPAPAAPAVQQEAVTRAVAEPSNPAAIATLPMRSDTQIFARANSWIELRSPAGDVLAQTYVRAGESYVVPAGISYRIIDAR